MTVWKTCLDGAVSEWRGRIAERRFPLLRFLTYHPLGTGHSNGASRAGGGGLKLGLATTPQSNSTCKRMFGERPIRWAIVRAVSSGSPPKQLSDFMAPSTTARTSRLMPYAPALFAASSSSSEHELAPGAQNQLPDISSSCSSQGAVSRKIANFFRPRWRTYRSPSKYIR